MKTLQQKQEIVNKNVIKTFKDKFNLVPLEFDTCWPLTKWDTIRTETRNFLVELKLDSGKVLNITETFE